MCSYHNALQMRTPIFHIRDLPTGSLHQNLITTTGNTSTTCKELEQAWNIWISETFHFTNGSLIERFSGLIETL